MGSCRQLSKYFLFLVFSVFVLLIFSFSVSAQISLDINGQINGMNSDFRAITNPLASTNYNGFDSLAIKPSSGANGYSLFYSMLGSNQLDIYSWPASADPITLQLVYFT